MKIIMYHYIRPKEDKSAYAFLDVDQFSKQVDYFQSIGNVLNKEQLIERFENNSFHDDDILLSFDDGFSDHYQYVYPILSEKDATGFFYVTSDALLNGKVLDVHIVHHLLALVPDGELLEMARKYVSDEMLSDAGRKEFANKTYLCQSNSQNLAYFKQLCNYYLEPEYKSNFLRNVASEYLDLEELHQTLYASSEQLRAMRSDSMMIGSHTCSHALLSKLTDDEQKKEITDSFKFLDEVGVLSTELKSFCYPYGGEHSYTTLSEQVLDGLDVKFSVDFDPRDCVASDIARRPQALPRYNCNQFEYGAATLVAP